jgi:hypothetical protein
MRNHLPFFPGQNLYNGNERGPNRDGLSTNGMPPAQNHNAIALLPLSLGNVSEWEG